MLVRVTRGTGRHEYLEYERVGIDHKGDLPDEEAFLSRLFRQFQAMQDRGEKGTYYLTPDQMGAVFTGTEGELSNG